MRYFFFIFFLVCTLPAFAQSTAPVRIDSGSQIHRPLPPTMLKELQRAQKNRTIVFSDTVRASDLEKLHFNDSVQQNYADSGFSMIDTAVSLPHKDWLDSELVEIPELAHFGSHIHFNYPPSLIMETSMNAVTFDTALVQELNPVTLEQLPFFDQSPMPRPLEPAKRSESFVEAGLGNVLLPHVEGWFAQQLSERSSFFADGNYESLNSSQSAIHQIGAVKVSLDAELGPAPSAEVFHSQNLNLDAGYTGTSIAFTNRTASDHSLGEFFGGGMLAGDLSQNFHYDASVNGNAWNDNLNNISETSLQAAIDAHLDVSRFRLFAGWNYSVASMTADTGGSNANFFGSKTTPIDVMTAKATIGDRSESTFEWAAGVELLNGVGPNDSTYSSVLPIAQLKYQINPRWDFGAAFEPEAQLASARILSGIDPFYSPGVVLQYRSSNSTIHVDARSVVMDKINLAAFMNYALSADDELRVEARYITRDREPIFAADTAKDSTTFFSVNPESTSRFEFTAAGNFLLFEKDVLSASAKLSSASLSSGGSIPFEPTSKFDAEYHFNSMWDNIQPSIAIQSVSRTGASFFFLDLKAKAEISHSIQLSFRAENILGSTSDFWPGYPEKPRSFWISGRYLF